MCDKPGSLKAIKEELDAIVCLLGSDAQVEVAMKIFEQDWKKKEPKFMQKWSTLHKGVKFTRTGPFSAGDPVVDLSETYNEVIKKLWLIQRRRCTPVQFVDQGVDFMAAQSVIAQTKAPPHPLHVEANTPRKIKMRIYKDLFSAKKYIDECSLDGANDISSIIFIPYQTPDGVNHRLVPCEELRGKSLNELQEPLRRFSLKAALSHESVLQYVQRQTLFWRMTQQVHNAHDISVIVWLISHGTSIHSSRLLLMA